MDNVKVLVVDDTEHVRIMLADMLELDGFDVVGQAASGPQAIEMVTELDPHVVVMDYKMPDMNGLTAAKEIRAKREDQPIILYTAFLDAILQQEAKEAGIALCVGKAEGLGQLERHIREATRTLTGGGQQTFNT